MAIITTLNKTSNIYSDVDLTLNNDKLYDIDSIYQSIRNILITPIGTRLFLREFGCDLSGLLFELMDESAKFAALDHIIRAINRWEPRVVVLPGLCTMTQHPEENTVDLNIVFQIKGLTETNYQFEFKYLRTILEGR